MNKVNCHIRGECRLRVCGVLPETVLNNCAMEAIELWDMVAEDEYTLVFSVCEADRERTRQIAERCMCRAELVSLRGGSRTRRFAGKHIWLFVSFVLMLVLLFCSTLFIWDIDIYGCDRLSEGEVMRALADCGVSCGSYWPSLSSDMIRSEMLLALPELAWMTVNVSGSRAAVLISERVEKPEIYEESRVAHILARTTGIISRVSVLNGKPLVKPGDSVVAGETLISGQLESLSREPRNVRSRGEVMAHTWHEISSVAPLEMPGKEPSGAVKRRFSLKLGGKRINLYFFGIKNVDECDKIVHNYILGMEGVFALPVELRIEKYIPYRKEGTTTADTAAMGERLSQLLDESVRGEILSRSISPGKMEGLALVTLRAACHEDIGILKEYTSAPAGAR